MSTRRVSRRASSGASASWCWASAAGCARSRRRWRSETFAWQVLCLRLAVIKCHARGEVDAGDLQIIARGRQALLLHAPRFAALHPRTLWLLAEEAEFWARGGPLALELPAA
jgi:exopolyphosphatase/guanosine-5'-triphosphate,3'-diphosphate pyrophosphatase